MAPALAAGVAAMQQVPTCNTGMQLQGMPVDEANMAHCRTDPCRLVKYGLGSKQRGSSASCDVSSSRGGAARPAMLAPLLRCRQPCKRWQQSICPKRRHCSKADLYNQNENSSGSNHDLGSVATPDTLPSNRSKGFFSPSPPPSLCWVVSAGPSAGCGLTCDYYQQSDGSGKIGGVLAGCPQPEQTSSQFRACVV